MCILLFFFKVYEILFENHILYEKVISINNYSTRARSVADTGEGRGRGGHPDPEKRGGAGLIKKCFGPLRALSLVYK